MKTKQNNSLRASALQITNGVRAAEGKLRTARPNRTVFVQICILITLLLAQQNSSAQVVISQVYGGGGNSGATYTNDFIELFNRGTMSVSVNGWSAQYASAQGSTWFVTMLSGTIQPGQYYLVQEAQGLGGTTPLPTPDATGSTSMSATDGKVALVSNIIPLTGTCPGGVVDFVGYGLSANCYEGSGPTATLSNTTAALRASDGCTDNNNNSTDFGVGAPNPRNTASPMHVCAVTITVQDTGDGTADATRCPGSGCRLRDALAAAHDGDTINFSVTTPATITLTSGQLVVGNSITITGLGANLLTVDANHGSRVFYINSGTTVTISGLKITNGHADDFGGGIYNDQAVLTVSNSTVSGNSASFAGGGIINDGATLTITNSTVSGNSANGGSGIFNDGIDFRNATLTITNSTVSGNSALGPESSGGGISNVSTEPGSATLTITNSTLSGNSAQDGGGIRNLGSNGSAMLTIGDTVLNAGASGANIYNEGGTIISLGYNLSSDAAGGDGTTGPGGFLNATGDIRNTDPKLGPLANNGGPTFTHALLTGSPAINAGNPSFTPPPDYDQRGPGYPRVVNGRIDIGSFEVQTIICPQPQGYWKNNPDAWPVNMLTLGSQTYTETELLTILRTPIGTGPKADASLILADQLIAAKLNIANGADGTPVTSTIADADAVLSSYGGKLPYRVRTNTTNGQRMVNDAATLESYNKGLLTPGCGG